MPSLKLFVDISVSNDYIIFLAFKHCTKSFCEGNASVMTACTAYGNYKLTSPLLDTLGNYERNQRIKMFFEFSRRRIVHNKASDILIESCQLLKLGNIKGIRKKSHIKYIIRILRYSVLETEGHTVNMHLLLCILTKH